MEQTSSFGSLTQALQKQWLRVKSMKVKLTRDGLIHHNPADCTFPVSPALPRGCQRADTHLQSPLGHSLTRNVVSDPIYLGKMTGNHHMHMANSPGILQSSKINSQVLDPLIPNLSSFWAVLNPGIPCKAKTIKIHLKS